MTIQSHEIVSGFHVHLCQTLDRLNIDIGDWRRLNGAVEVRFPNDPGERVIVHIPAMVTNLFPHIRAELFKNYTIKNVPGNGNAVEIVGHSVTQGLASKLAARDARIESLNTEIRDGVEEIRRLSDSLFSMTNRVNELQSHCAQFESENRTLKSQKEAATTDISDLKVIIRNSRGEIGKLHSQIACLKGELAECLAILVDITKCFIVPHYAIIDMALCDRINAAIIEGRRRR